MTSYFSVTDLFCGCGGSAEGLATLRDVEITTAANHWQIALESHAANHPKTHHVFGDLRQTHPSQFAKTTMLWASPECTNHSLSKGVARKGITQRTLWGDDNVDPEEERSRATMREVVEFSAYHDYPLVVVENVTEIRYWAYYEDWLRAMHNMGYQHKEVFLNSMHGGVPQSRDRIYVCFWKRGNHAPNLDMSPVVYCAHCGHDVDTRWAKKNEQNILPGKVRYGEQYIYRCVTCHREVKPYTQSAASIIDWTLPTTKIKDRKKPLVENTMRRLERGLAKYSLQPFMMRYYGRDSAHSPITEPLPTITTFNNQHAVLTPPAFISSFYGNDTDRSIAEPLPTIMTKEKHALIGMADTLPECSLRMLQVSELQRGMAFPDSYIVLGTSNEVKTKQLGNAVTPPVARLLGQRMFESLGG